MTTHLGFILAAYGLTAVVVAIMVIALVVDHRSLRRDLARFHDRGAEGEG